MKVLLGIIVGVTGAAVSAYLGIVVFFVGGIERIISGANAHPTDGSKIAWGVVQVLVADWVAVVIAVLFIFLGFFIATDESYKRPNKFRHAKPYKRPTRF